MFVVTGSSGISGKAGSKPRVHVRAQDWGNFPGTDYWFDPTNVDIITASAPGLLSAQGWVGNGTLDIVASSQGNFLATTVPTTLAGLRFNAAGETLRSPLRFGSVDAYRWIRDQMGWAPTKLVAEFYGQFTAAAANEPGSGFGFVKGALTTATNGVAVIASDGTNFRGKTSATDFTGAMTGAAVDTAAHLWRIQVGPSVVTFYMDNVAIGTSMALPTGCFPCAFAGGAATANFNVLGPAHVYYD